jgi:hypothetical protein
MSKPSARDSLLAVLGITALIVYVLACRPSFSPDGTKVIFPTRDGKTKGAAVVLYDLRKKSLETIFALPPMPKEDDAALAVQWLPDGKQVLINGISFVAVLPLGSSNPTRFLPLDQKLDAGVLQMTPPVIGKYQFIPSKTSVQIKNEKGETVSVDKPIVLRVNLETMEVQDFPDGIEGNFVTRGNQLYYIAQAKIGADDAYELGRVDIEKITRIPIIQLKEKDYGEPSGYMTPNSTGNRIALTAKLEHDPRILLIRDDKLDTSIPVPEKDAEIQLGNAEWSLDERTVFVAFARDLGKDGLWQYGVLEVPLGGGKTREIPLFVGKDGNNGGLVLLQIALSADGRRIAATSAFFGADKENKSGDHALYLIDLSSSKRDVTRIAIPLAPSSESSVEK